MTDIHILKNESVNIMADASSGHFALGIILLYLLNGAEK